MAKERSIRKFVMLPWLKGMDSCIDEGIMHLLRKGDALVQADNIVYDMNGSKDKREGFGYHDSGAATGSPEFKGGYDYWANLSGTKTQKLVLWDGQATSKCWFQSPGGGSWTELTKNAAATAPTSVTSVCFEVFNDDLVMAFECANNTPPKKWDNMGGANEYVSLGGSPPQLKYIRTHQGRLWGAGDPTRPDRLFFSGPGNHEEWNGDGDSGAIDIDPGDGDSSGITAIFPSFKGRLIVAKRSRLYQIEGTTPEDYKVTPITKGIGCISHNSCVAVDLDDIYFMSDRGFHSLTVTQKYGDFEGEYLSQDIQRTFNTWSKSKLKYSQGVWIPTLNSIMWSVSENGNRLDALWLYDIRYKAWYRWTGSSPTALFRVQDATAGTKRAYFGNEAGRLVKTQISSTYHDYASTAISQVIKTPFLYPDNDPSAIKGFKKLGIWVKMDSDVELSADIRQAGNNSTQTLTFSTTSAGKPTLDVDFVLGSSILGATGQVRMTPMELPFDGFSSSVQITFTQAVADEKCAIFGFWIEWEPAGDSQESVGY